MPLEAQPDALLGSVLEGRFQIERLLGEGGMGRVYVADELRLRRRCAVKVLLPDLVDDPGCVERFLREASPTPEAEDHQRAGASSDRARACADRGS